MATWSNWSGRHIAQPDHLHFARHVDDVSAVVAHATTGGRRIRVAGSGHSHYPLVPTDDVIVDLSGLAGLIDVDRDTLTARMWGGTTIRALGQPLHDNGVALANQGDIDRQSIAGAIATGTHGTGRTLHNLSAGVTALTLVTAAGDVVRCSSTAHPELFEAARLHLGAFGVVAQVELSVLPAYRLAELGWRAGYDEVRPEIEGHVADHRHFEFFWYPPRDLAIVKAIDVTERAAEYPLAGEGSRVAWSYEVLPNHRPDLHTEMEFAVPVERSLECLDEIRSLLLGDFPDLTWPVEYRTVAADDVWLSQAYERDVATISVHQGVDHDDEPLFRACEAVFRRYDGRPHWGKVHYFTGDELAAAHPRWHDWWERRDAIDPTGTFLNDALAAWRG
jgi:L-gulonolactone oxidase